jgi:hypothetical protein
MALIEEITGLSPDDGRVRLLTTTVAMGKASAFLTNVGSLRSVSTHTELRQPCHPSPTPALWRHDTLFGGGD